MKHRNYYWQGMILGYHFLKVVHYEHEHSGYKSSNNPSGKFSIWNFTQIEG